MRRLVDTIRNFNKLGCYRNENIITSWQIKRYPFPAGRWSGDCHERWPWCSISEGHLLSCCASPFNFKLGSIRVF